MALLKIFPSKICDTKVSHQHIHTVCCRGEVKALIPTNSGCAAESAAIAGARVILNTNLLSILQTYQYSKNAVESVCVCLSRVLNSWIHTCIL